MRKIRWSDSSLGINREAKSSSFRLNTVLRVNQRSGKNIYASTIGRFHEQVGLPKICKSTLYTKFGIILTANQTLGLYFALPVMSECSRLKGDSESLNPEKHTYTRIHTCTHTYTHIHTHREAHPETHRHGESRFIDFLALLNMFLPHHFSFRY